MMHASQTPGTRNLPELRAGIYYHHIMRLHQTSSAFTFEPTSFDSYSFHDQSNSYDHFSIRGCHDRSRYLYTCKEIAVRTFISLNGVDNYIPYDFGKLQRQVTLRIALRPLAFTLTPSILYVFTIYTDLDSFMGR